MTLEQGPLTLLLDEPTLRNSVICSAIGVVISLACSMSLFRRAFAEQLGHQFMASDSAILFMTQRCKLLFLAALLTFIDAGRNLTQWLMIWDGRQLPDLLLVRIVYLFTFVVALPLQTYATCQRCAVVVTSKPEQRATFLRATMWTCAISMLVVQGGIIYRILELLQGEAGTRLWLDVTFVPNSVVAFSAIFPFIIMVSSTWALTVNVARARVTAKPREGGAVPGQSGSLPSQYSASMSAPAESAIGAPNQSQMALESARNRSYSTLASVSTAVLTAAKRTKRAVTSGSHRQNGRFMYPLSRTFIVLSFALISLWVFAMAASILEFLPYTRTNALNSALNAMCIAVEASFEKLLRCVKQAQKKKNEELAVDKTFGGVTEDVSVEVSQAAVGSSSQSVEHGAVGTQGVATTVVNHD